jgi:hypothetical protein
MLDLMANEEDKITEFDGLEAMTPTQPLADQLRAAFAGVTRSAFLRDLVQVADGPDDVWWEQLLASPLEYFSIRTPDTEIFAVNHACPETSGKGTEGTRASRAKFYPFHLSRLSERAAAQNNQRSRYGHTQHDRLLIRKPRLLAIFWRFRNLQLSSSYHQTAKETREVKHPKKCKK